MGKWADLARKIEGEKPRANSADSVISPPIGTNGGIGTAKLHVPPSEPEARAILRNWHGKLSGLDEFTPPSGFTPGRWADLCRDAYWLYETHASRLVREGWSALDAFGVLPWRENGGVLLDRLKGARNLRLDGEGRAYWTSRGVTSVTCRGFGETLVSSGLVAVWELLCSSPI